MFSEGRVGIDAGWVERQHRRQRPGCVFLLRIPQSLRLLLPKPDQNVLNVLGIVCHHPELNQDPNPSGNYSPTCPVSNWFKDCTIRPSGGVSVAGSGLGQSFGLIMVRVLIFLWDIVLLTACYLPPKAVRFFLDILSEGWGADTPPVLDSSTERYRIPDDV